MFVSFLLRYVVDTTTWTARKLGYPVHLPLVDGVPEVDLSWLRVQRDEDEQLMPEPAAAGDAPNPAEDGLVRRYCLWCLLLYIETYLMDYAHDLASAY